MARKHEPDFWLKDKKKSLGDSFNRMTSYGLPKQAKPVPKPNPIPPQTTDLSNSYIRMEQIDHATRQLAYSEFLDQVTLHGGSLASKGVESMDLFIRCLRPNVQVSCEFNSILRSGFVELIRSESTARTSDAYCNDTKSIVGKAILIDEKVGFEVCYEGNFLVMKNVTGLKIAMEVINQVFQAEIKTVSFRRFENRECIQVIRAVNPIHRIKPDMPRILTFVKVMVD